MQKRRQNGLQQSLYTGTGLQGDGHGGLVNSGKVSTSSMGDPGITPCFPWSSHSNDLKIGTLVLTLPGAWCHRVSGWNGLPGVSVLWLGELASLIFSFCLTLAGHAVVLADLSLRSHDLHVAGMLCKRERNKQAFKAIFVMVNGSPRGQAGVSQM